MDISERSVAQRSIDPASRARDFLRERSGKPYCVSCLGKALGFDGALVGSIVIRLRLVFFGFAVRKRTCSACRRVRGTILAER